MKVDKEPNLIAKFSNLFVKRYRISILLILSLVTFGAFAYTTLLDREGFPSIEVPIAIVQTPYFVNDTKIVNEEITTPLENSLEEIDEVERISSKSGNNFSNIVVQFPEGMTSQQGADLIEDEIGNTLELPENVEPNFISLEAGKINGIYDILITLSGDDELTQLQQKAVKISEKFEDAEGIGTAEVIELFEERVNPITGEEQTVQVGFNRSADIQNGEENFRNAINIGITKDSDDIDTIELSNLVREEAEKLDDDGELNGYEISYPGDFAVSLQKQISLLETNAASALLIVVLVLFFLVNWRASIISAGFVVVVMATTMAGLYLIGFSLNVLSLFALILILGLIVDDAIVVVDAIDYQKKQGYKDLTAITRAINSVGVADISGSITTILVFIPMAGISGVLGSFIKFIPYTVILALVISIIVGLSLIPFASYFILADKKEGEKWPLFEILSRILNFVPEVINKIGMLVSRFVNLYIKVPILGILIIISTFALIYLGSSYQAKLPFEIFPSPKDADEISISLTFEEYIDIDQAERISTRVEDTLLEKYKEQIELASYLEANDNSAMLSVNLIPLNSRDITAIQINEYINDQFVAIEKTTISFTENNLNTIVNVQFTGIDDKDEAKEKLDIITQRIRDLGLEIGEPIDVDTSEVQIIVEKTNNSLDRLEEEFGLSVKANIVSAGPPTAEYQFSMQIFDEDTDDLKTATDIISDYIRNWEYDENSEIKTIEVNQPSFSSIRKLDGQRYIQIEARLTEDADTAAVLALGEDIKQEFDTDQLKDLGLGEEALGFDLGQESENLESFESAITTTIIALLVMYVLLVIQFDSFTLPLLIFTAIPFSFPGLFPGLYLTDNPFSFFTMIGIIGLIGIVVNNTIMLLDYAKQERRDGKTIRESIVEATRVRFRPLLTTSVTTIVGLIPLAISDPFWESLGFSIIFGLASSTFFVIIAFPAFYMLLEYLRFARNMIIKYLRNLQFREITKFGLKTTKRVFYPIWR